MSGASTWNGTAGGGVKFSNFINKSSIDYYNSDGSFDFSHSDNYKLVNDDGNQVKMTIHFK